MRAIALCAAAFIAVSSAEAGAAGWKTIVTDGVSGTRTAGLIGSAGEKEAPGILLACSGDAATAPVLTIIAPPSGLYSSRPGDTIPVDIGGESLRGELTQNDSRQTAVIVDSVAARALLDAISSAPFPLRVKLALSDAPVEFAIPADGMTVAIENLRVACGL